MNRLSKTKISPYIKYVALVLVVLVGVYSIVATPSPTKPSTGVMIDQDRNQYKTVRIGSTWWMAENLRVTHYRNGDLISNVTDPYQWVGLASLGAYCAYDNDVSNAEPYGYLYNGHAVGDPRNIAPEGWHVPTDGEWKALEMY